MVNTVLKSVDFYPEHLEMLDKMMTATGKPRNWLIREAVKLLFAHPDEWPEIDILRDIHARDNNTCRQTTDEEVMGVS
jgi:hypothetical protein